MMARTTSLRTRDVAFLSLVCATALIGVSDSALADRRADPAKMLTFWQATFADTLSASDAVKQECRTEELLNAYIKSNAPPRGASIQFAESEEQFKQSPNQLHVAIADVDSNEWRFPRVRPSSLVTFDIRIVIDDKIVKQTRKQIRSGGPLGFGVCQRVEKIAKAGGAFVAEWVARSDYQTVSQRTIGPPPAARAEAAAIDTAEHLAEKIESSVSEADADEPPTNENDPVRRLEQLEELRSKNLISQDEYEAKRREVVDSI